MTLPSKSLDFAWARAGRAMGTAWARGTEPGEGRPLLSIGRRALILSIALFMGTEEVRHPA